jgi:putative transposase
MPRQPRLDAPGLLHHVISRGIDRRTIFHDKADYDDFLSRLETALAKSPNQILAWALMPNHFHLLVRSGAGGLSRFMRRLMSGYALAFNARHKRSGYLFQNRYKSFVCDEEAYLLELVRYIHLNPLRGRLVVSVAALGRFPYSGHSALLGAVLRPWQETQEVLSHFGSRSRYEKFIEEGKDQRRRPDLMGGGLKRSLGGMAAALQARRESDRQAYDERVLGNGDFVTQVLKQAEAAQNQKAALKRKGIDLRAAAKRVAKEAGLSEKQLFRRGRTAQVSQAKALLIYLGIEYLERTAKEMAGLTRMTVAAASKARERGESLFEKSRVQHWLVD